MTRRQGQVFFYFSTEKFLLLKKAVSVPYRTASSSSLARKPSYSSLGIFCAPAGREFCPLRGDGGVLFPQGKSTKSLLKGGKAPLRIP